MEDVDINSVSLATVSANPGEIQTNQAEAPTTNVGTTGKMILPSDDSSWILNYGITDQMKID